MSNVDLPLGISKVDSLLRVPENSPFTVFFIWRLTWHQLHLMTEDHATILIWGKYV